MIRRSHAVGRSAAYIPEFCLVAIFFFMILCGMIEYARYLFTVNTMFNAAREGARYAITHTDTMTTNQVCDYIDGYMAGQGIQLNNYAKYTNITLFQADPTTGADNGGGWQNAGQAQAIGVKITGTFSEIVPSLLRMGGSPTITVTVIMYSEAY
jgi:Flp pilus assembly protein TadG